MKKLFVLLVLCMGFLAGANAQAQELVEQIRFF